MGVRSPLEGRFFMMALGHNFRTAWRKGAPLCRSQGIDFARKHDPLFPGVRIQHRNS